MKCSVCSPQRVAELFSFWSGGALLTLEEVMKIAELDRVVNAAKKHQELLEKLQKSEDALVELKSALIEKAERTRASIGEDESRMDEDDGLADLVSVLESDPADLEVEDLEVFRTASWWEE